jgi:hypothetical protein
MVKNKNEKLNKYNYTVDWGDGTVDNFTTYENGYFIFRRSDCTHKYVTPDTYTATFTVKIEECDDRNEPEKSNEPIKNKLCKCDKVLDCCLPPVDKATYCSTFNSEHYNEMADEPKSTEKNCYYCKNVLNDCYPPSDDMSYCDNYAEYIDEPKQVEKRCSTFASEYSDCHGLGDNMNCCDECNKTEKQIEPNPIEKKCLTCVNVLDDCYPPSDNMSYCDDYVEYVEKSCSNCAKFLKECYPPDNYDRSKAKHCSNYKEQE